VVVQLSTQELFALFFALLVLSPPGSNKMVQLSKHAKKAGLVGHTVKEHILVQ
jgi:hypothetical protein